MTAGNGHRLGVVDADHPGTAASAWTAMRDAAPLDWSAWTDVVVVAPHPDDEVLGVGGLMAVLVRAQVPVRVLAVTDGEAACPPGWIGGQALSDVRVREGVSGCAWLGVGAPERLRFPDGGVAGAERALTGALADRLDGHTTCLATWSGDGHPDHEAVGRAARLACQRTGATLVEYPVWMWHWAAPWSPAVPWERARRLDLDLGVAARKRRAVDCHRSQLDPPAPGESPVLPAFVVERLVTDRELVFA